MENHDLIEHLDSINKIAVKYESDYAEISNRKQQIKKCDNEIKELKIVINQYENYKAKPNKLEEDVLNSKHGSIYKIIHNYFFILSIIWFIFIVVYGICYLFNINLFKVIFHDKISIISSVSIFLGCPILFVPSSLKNDSRKYVLKNLQEKTDKFKKEYEPVYEEGLRKIESLNTGKNLQSALLVALNKDISCYEKQFNEFIYLIPRKYMTSQATNLFKEYLQYGRAFTIGECINLYEIEKNAMNSQKQHEEIMMMENEKNYFEQIRHEELLHQNEENINKQEELNKKLAIQNEQLIKQNKEKIKIEKLRLEEERRREEERKFEMRQRNLYQ